MATTKKVTEQLQTSIVVQKIKNDANKLIKKLDVLSIESRADYDTAAITLKNLKEYKVKGVAEEAKITDPLKTALKNTQALFKPFYDEVSRIELQTKQAMIAFDEKEEAAKLKLQQDFESGKIKKVTTLMGKQAEFTHQSNGASSVRTIKVLEIEDLNKVPREFLLPDEAAIKKVLMAGGKVAGCKLATKKSIAV